MLTPLHIVTSSAAGQLAVTARPRGHDWLPDEVENWRAQGVTDVVSALTPSEVAELGLDAEEELCRKVGITFHSFPILDRVAPENAVEFVSLSRSLAGLVSDGAFVAAHCRMGIGRAGMIAASVLIQLGATASEAFSTVSSARGTDVPDTPEQAEWVAQHIRADSNR